MAWSMINTIIACSHIKDNVGLLTPEILDKINQVVVNAGHELIKKKARKRRIAVSWSRC